MVMRNDQAACGTSTTGTGTLTLAAPPSAITSADPYAIWSGSGFGTTTGIIVDYSIVEYTDSACTTPKQSEAGRGTLLFGANLAATTFARTKIIQTATSMNSPPATVVGQTSAPSAITIGTAANVVVWFGLSSFSPMASLPFYVTSGITSGDNLGASVFQRVIANGSSVGYVNQRLYYQRVLLGHSDLIKSVTVQNAVAYTGGTSSLKMGLYEILSTGLPGKLLLDFGTQGSIPANTNTLTASSAVFFPAGYYILGVLAQFTGGSGSPSIRCADSVAPSPFGTYSPRNFVGPCPIAYVASQTALSDPATTTSITAIDVGQEFGLAFRST